MFVSMAGCLWRGVMRGSRPRRDLNRAFRFVAANIKKYSDQHDHSHQNKQLLTPEHCRSSHCQITLRLTRLHLSTRLSCRSAARRQQSLSSKRVRQHSNTHMSSLLIHCRHRCITGQRADCLEYQCMHSSPSNDQEHTRSIRR